MLLTDRPEAGALPPPPGSCPAPTGGPGRLSPADGRGDSPVLPRGEAARRLRPLRWGCWGIVLLIGAFDALYAPFATGRIAQHADVPAYIDIAWAYARGDWAHALNSYWSPLYSWLLALAFRGLHPSAATEITVAHGLNVIILAAALGSFEYLLRVWMPAEMGRRGDGGTGGRGDGASPAPPVCLPPWALRVIAYSLFIWTATGWIGVQLVTPDLLVAGLVYLASGLALRLRQGQPQPWVAAVLGGVLGLGFLAKAVMLPLAPLFLGVGFLPVRNARRAALSLLAAGIAFLIVTGPFIAVLSRKAGHLTVGDTGRLNYAWWVDGVPPFHWRGEIPGQGTALHPTRRIYPSPPVYEFASPIGGTYPIWTDPSYWYAGVRARFNGRQQVIAVLKNLTEGRTQMPGTGPGGLVAIMLGLVMTIGLAVKRRLPPGVRWDMLLIAVAPAVLYTLVVVESRYLGANVALLFLALLPAIRLPANKLGKALVVPVTLLIWLLPGLGVARAGAADMARRQTTRGDWEAATALHAFGIQPGDRIGCIGLTWKNAWALYAQVSIVAEIPSNREWEYWSASPRVRAAALRAFAKAGVRAVVTGRPPLGAAEGWQPLGSSGRYVHLFPSTAPESRSALSTTAALHTGRLKSRLQRHEVSLRRLRRFERQASMCGWSISLSSALIGAGKRS